MKGITKEDENVELRDKPQKFDDRGQKVTLYHWKTDKYPAPQNQGGATIDDQKRDIYQVVGSGRVYKTTSNRKTAEDLAKTLSRVPATVAPALAEIPPKLLIQIAEGYGKLEPVLTPLEMSVHAGLEEYAALKARTGKLVLGELFESLLTGFSSPVNTATFAERLRDISVAIAKLTPILEPLNISVASAIDEYAAVKAKAGTQDLRELFAQLLSKTWVERSKTPVADVLESFLDAKRNEAGVSDEYYKRLYYMLNFMVEHLPPGIAIGAVTTEMLKETIYRPEVGAWSKRTNRGNVLTFFHWCQLNKYLDYSQPTAADPLEQIRLPKPAPRILTVPEAAAMLRAIEDPWCLLFLALSLFCGIRHDELQKLSFELIKRGTCVDITDKISKTQKRRLVPIQPVLDAWLSPFYGRSGLVMPIANIQAKVHAFLRASDVPDLPRGWSRNWLRQSYCSYRLAQTGNVLETAAEDGHHAYVLERVYAHRSTPQDAEAFFALTPQACGKPDWHERVTAFLAEVPELRERTKIKTRGWKPIDGKGRRTLPPGVSALTQPA